MSDLSKGQPGESENQRADRELIELLNELRVVLPGVQVPFASCSRCRSRTGSPG